MLSLAHAGAPHPLLPPLLDTLQSEQVRESPSAAATLALFLEFDPDVVLLDLAAFGGDGIDGVNLIKQLSGVGDFPVPILAFTLSESVELKRRALAAGVRGVMTERQDPADVVRTVSSLMADRLHYLDLINRNSALQRQILERTAQAEDAMRQLRRTQEQLGKQERLRALGMMAGGVAHDFNNALTMMLGYGELLLPFVQANAPARERGYLQHVISAAQDASHVVSRLKEFYRPSGTHEPRVAVDVNEVIRQAIGLTAPRWNSRSLAEGVQIDIRMELEDTPRICGNAPELREILTNLIFNAVDAMPSGGIIRVSSRRLDDRVLIAVADSGVGMCEETRHRCIEPFFTTKGDQGTGLGLALVYGIVQRHGGLMDVKSTLNAGTTFTLSFPIADVADDELPPPVERIGRPLRILVVDDQEIICELISEHLRSDGHTVGATSHCRAALDLLDQETFDLVITDQSMPEMNGSQFASVLKKKWAELPVILLTGFGEEMQAMGQQPEGIDLVLGKPVTAADLRRAVFLAISRSGRHDALEEIAASTCATA